MFSARDRRTLNRLGNLEALERSMIVVDWRKEKTTLWTEIQDRLRGLKREERASKHRLKELNEALAKSMHQRVRRGEEDVPADEDDVVVYRPASWED